MNATEAASVYCDGKHWHSCCATHSQRERAINAYSTFLYDDYPKCGKCGAPIKDVRLSEGGRVRNSPYRLNLTDDEYKALEWIGDRYAHGADLLKLLDDCPMKHSWPRAAEYGLTESQALQLLDIGGESDYRWDCLAGPLAEKLQALCDSIV